MKKSLDHICLKYYYITASLQQKRLPFEKIMFECNILIKFVYCCDIVLVYVEIFIFIFLPTCDKKSCLMFDALVSNYNYNSLIMRIHETLMLLYIIAGIACSCTDSLQYIVFEMQKSFRDPEKKKKVTS